MNKIRIEKDFFLPLFLVVFCVGFGGGVWRTVEDFEKLFKLDFEFFGIK
jgi:hypothetical protein